MPNQSSGSNPELMNLGTDKRPDQYQHCWDGCGGKPPFLRLFEKAPYVGVSKRTYELICELFFFIRCWGYIENGQGVVDLYNYSNLLGNRSKQALPRAKIETGQT
jgi:hypothetical protein